MSADALAVGGVALAYLGEEARALASLNEAVAVAKNVHDARIDKVAELNVSEQGVVTPKAIAVEAEILDLLLNPQSPKD